MSFALAHFSDLHLPPVYWADVFGAFKTKRVIGGLSWAFNRRYLHQSKIASALAEDVKSQSPDHIAFTGDLVNIAAEAEFTRGAAWLNALGSGPDLSYTPGNHDAYVKIASEKSLDKLKDYFASDAPRDEPFPFLRLRRNVAIVGLSSAQPQSLWSARGTIGERQRNAASAMLNDLRQKGFFRVLMIHHSPLVGASIPPRALTDAAEMEALLKATSPELVLHGHNHQKSFARLETENGIVPVIGVPSASMTGKGQHDPASWNMMRITRSKGKWQTAVETRQWHEPLQAFAQTDSFTLPER